MRNPPLSCHSFPRLDRAFEQDSRLVHSLVPFTSSRTDVFIFFKAASSFQGNSLWNLTDDFDPHWATPPRRRDAFATPGTRRFQPDRHTARTPSPVRFFNIRLKLLRR